MPKTKFKKVKPQQGEDGSTLRLLDKFIIDHTRDASVLDGLVSGEMLCTCDPKMYTGYHLKKDPGDEIVGMWCEHIERVITEGNDAALYGEEYAVGNFASRSVVVPLRPTQAFWVRVQVGEIYDDQPFCSLSIPARGQATMLGYITDGDGRLVMRQMVIAYLRGKYLSAPPCRHPHHQGRLWSTYDKRDQHAMPTDGLAQIHSLLLRNKCLNCFLHSSPMSDSDMAADAPDI